MGLAGDFETAGGGERIGEASCATRIEAGRDARVRSSGSNSMSHSVACATTEGFGCRSFEAFTAPPFTRPASS